MNKRDVLLAVLNAAGGQPLTPVQLQKSLFLISRANLPEITGSFYTFEPYHYGPFDIGIYRDAEILQKEGLVVRAPSPQGSWTNTMITPQGQVAAAEKEMSIKSKEFVQEVVKWVQSLSFNDLVRSIYKVFPEFKQNSVFQD